MSENEQQPVTEEPPLKLARLPVFAGIALIAVYSIYFGLIKGAPGGGPDSWGQFGDFFGGVLNPIVGTITIVLLIHTLRAQLKAIELQRRELTLQRNELQLQRVETARSTEALAAQNKAIMMQSFEQTFFAWLQSYRMLVDSVELGNLKGQRLLIDLVQPFLGARQESPASERILHQRMFTYDEAFDLHLNGNSSILATRYQSALSAFKSVYKSNHTSLGPMLRTLYRLIEWIDHASLETEDKWHYVSIVRSQLSWPEMMIIAYNGATDRGKNFVPLIDKYALLDNLDPETDKLVAAMRGPFLVRQPEHFPYTKCAFNSTEAKLEMGFIEEKDL
ncbi:hypothetical protein A7J67_08365 [Achromobacter xylosoxidans]|nr:hypothetical protein A7J67_08365 [Achromobacter xylosoxidans]